MICAHHNHEMKCNAFPSPAAFIPTLSAVCRTRSSNRHKDKESKLSKYNSGLDTLGLAFAFVALSVGLARAADTVYDLNSDWSNITNPNGPWTLMQGSAALPHDPDWTALSETDPAYTRKDGKHIAQPAWAPGNQQADYLPAWFKAAVNPKTAGADWKRGDIVFHTTDTGNGQGSGSASVLFTVPTAGRAIVSGYIYNGRNNLGRDQVWQLLVAGSVVASGDLPGNGTVTRKTKTVFKLPAMRVQAGEEIQLIGVENSGDPGGGDFLGTDLKVILSPK
jgi:hypothetical protein